MNRIKKEWRTIIVDDERLARLQLRDHLSHFETVKVIAEAGDVKSAVKIVNDLQPELIFLDIQMPGESGFDLLHQINFLPKIVFVTAYDQYAIRAFEVNALDYLLKPINPQRLAQAVARLRGDDRQEEFVETIKPLEYDDFLFIAVGEQADFIKVSTIVCIRADGVYSEVTINDGRKLVLHKSLKQWLKQLPAKHFAQIHRSTVINLENIERVEQWFNYSYQVYLQNIKEPLVMSRRFVAQLKNNRS
jgi:two-component system LytT family response regulator